MKERKERETRGKRSEGSEVNDEKEGEKIETGKCREK